jgi:Glycosyl transferase family 2
VQCPTLSELPKPSSDRTGWPWTEESRRLPSQTSDGHPWPRISVVTPSYNQGHFIEETIRSVLLQGYPNLEYLVIDGASTDNSIDIIKKYSPWLSYWISKPDAGQSDAINRGLKRATGEFATWINSDDLLCKDALVDHASQVGFDSNVVYAGICIYIHRLGKPVSSHQGRVLSFEDLVRIGTVWRSEGHQGHIVQPEVLFPREMALSVGGLNTNNHFTMDYELWGRLFLAGAKFQYTKIPFGMFREHQKQKIHDMLRQTRSLIDTATKLVSQADCLSETTKNEILADLEAYRLQYEKQYWEGSGRLAKIGLPRSLVLQLRRLRALVQNTMGGASPS